MFELQKAGYWLGQILRGKPVHWTKCRRCMTVFDERADFYCPTCQSCQECGCCPCRRAECSWCHDALRYAALELARHHILNNPYHENCEPCNELLSELGLERKEANNA